MLSENVQLRGRIIELEKQVENNETRRIADHALAIKAKLEAQLTEWGGMISELGLEPPPKRHSPYIRRSSKSRSSFSHNRPSPSQRRLRDVAKDIEELGHISEHKSFPRRSMKYVYDKGEIGPILTVYSPEQILALRTEADVADTDDSPADSPDLGPPPMSKFIQDEAVKDSPLQLTPSKTTPKKATPSPKGILQPPELLPSPQPDRQVDQSPSPQKKKDPQPPKKLYQKPDETKSSEPKKQWIPQPEPLTASTPKSLKRKLATREEAPQPRPLSKTNENQPPRVMAGKARDKAERKPLKDLATRKEERAATGASRKPLSSKSTNDDIASPKKKTKPAGNDDISSTKAGKAGLDKSKHAHEQTKPKAKKERPPLVEIKPEPALEPEPAVAAVEPDLGTPLAEPELLAPNSPLSAAPADVSRGDTPPPADISAEGETTRGSRRSRGVVSYAEPSLRDKMRRPGKQMMDAVAGSRRSSAIDLIPHDSAKDSAKNAVKVKRESVEKPVSETPQAPEPGSIPASPLANKSAPSPEVLPPSVTTERKKRVSSAMFKDLLKDDDDDDDEVKEESKESITLSDVDVYDFTPNSPQVGKQGKKRGTRAKSSRRYSTALEGEDDAFAPPERPPSRRRSMMV